MVTLIVAVVCILAGGYGGFAYGSAVEKKAAAALAAGAASVASTATSVSKKV